MKKIIATLTTGIILLGVIGFGLNMLFKTDVVSYMSVETINGITYYKYDFHNYVRTLANTLESIPDLKLTIPETDWWESTDIIGWLSALGHNLSIILNWMLFGLNVVLYPFRIIFFTIKLILTVIGINMLDTSTGNPLDWLKALANVMIRLEIPYV